MSETPDWSETQAKLLKDIDAFARRKLDLSAVDAAEKARRESEFPQIDPNAAPRAAPTAAEKPTADPEPARPAPGGSLLDAGRQIAVERENPAHEAFAKALHDAGIQFQAEESRNARNHVERTVFTFPCEVRAGFGFTADYEQGDIRLVLRNVRRFGGAEYRLSHEALDQGTLEEMARLLMGEESRFEKMFRRAA